MSTPLREVDTTRSPVSARNLASAVVGGYLPLVLATMVVTLPLLWMVLASFRSVREIVSTTPSLFPETVSAENYALATERAPLVRAFGNSALVTAIGAGLKVVLAVMTAYALVFVRFPGRDVVFFGLLITLMVPPQVSLLPNYVFISGIGGADTYWGIILPGLGTAFGTFLLRQHFLTIPASLLEAAQLDGAGHLRRLLQIVVPVSTPSIATVALVNIVFEWNEYLWPLVIVTDPDMMTLPVALTLLFNSESGAANYGPLMAGTVLVILPVLIVFVALQRYVIAGLTQGAVKD